MRVRTLRDTYSTGSQEQTSRTACFHQNDAGVKMKIGHLICGLKTLGRMSWQEPLAASDGRDRVCGVRPDSRRKREIGLTHCNSFTVYPDTGFGWDSATTNSRRVRSGQVQPQDTLGYPLRSIKQLSFLGSSSQGPLPKRRRAGVELTTCSLTWYSPDWWGSSTCESSSV